MIQHILFPVDFSGPCAELGPVVRSWARQFGARITMLHAFEGPGVYSLESLPLELELKMLRESGRRRVSDFLLEVFSGIELERIQIESPAASAIVNYAQNNSVGLIMMPTLGYTRFRQLLLGSVTASVLHDSEVPVWTSAHQAERNHPAIPRRILCAVDCGKETESVLRMATGVAQACSASLHVVHIRPQPSGFETGTSQMAHHFAERVALEDYAKAAIAVPGAPALTIEQAPSLLAGVQQAIQHHQADLLIIGRGRIHGFLGRLRSDAHDLIRASGCPVLSV
jgi:nucleotide-binding universal stress UspA family protein